METTQEKKQISYDGVLFLLNEIGVKLAKTEALIDKNAEIAEKRSAETDRKLRAVGKQIGDWGNAFGKYTEGLLGPSIRKILKEKLGMDTVSRNAESLKQKTRYEIDYLGTVNGETNKAVLVDVKSNLHEKHIDQLKSMIEKV